MTKDTANVTFIQNYIFRNHVDFKDGDDKRNVLIQCVIQRNIVNFSIFILSTWNIVVKKVNSEGLKHIAR